MYLSTWRCHRREGRSGRLLDGTARVLRLSVDENLGELGGGPADVGGEVHYNVADSHGGEADRDLIMVGRGVEGVGRQGDDRECGGRASQASVYLQRLDARVPVGEWRQR